MSVRLEADAEAEMGKKGGLLEGWLQRQRLMSVRLEADAKIGMKGDCWQPGCRAEADVCEIRG